MATYLNDAKRRLQRIFGAWLAHEAWKEGADAVKIPTSSIQKVLASSAFSATGSVSLHATAGDLFRYPSWSIR
jgi:hypothetical protein